MKIASAEIASILFTCWIAGCGATAGRPLSPPYNPNIDRVRKTLAFDDALALARARPGEGEPRATLVRVASDYFAFIARYHFESVRDASRRERAAPFFEATLSSDAACDVKREALMLLPEERALTWVTDDGLRTCLKPVIHAVVTLFRRHDACDAGVQWAAAMWPLASSNEERVNVLDAIDLCSDAVNRDAHFARLPPAALSVCGEALARRESERRAAARAQATQRCESACSNQFGSGGSCNHGCRGDAPCLQNCAALGDQCLGSCR